MEAFFGAYRAFTAKPDEMLARRGLSRVHHRILFFISHQPGLSVSELLIRLGNDLPARIDTFKKTVADAIRASKGMGPDKATTYGLSDEARRTARFSA